MALNFPSCAALAATVALFAAACGANNTASQIRGDALTANDALHDGHNGGDCHVVDQPLVVDADESLRGQIETKMKSSIALVSYDCKKIKLLSCSAPGDYSYSGFSIKQKAFQLSNSDELKANMPFSGAAIAAKFEAEMTKGLAIDIAWALVGQKTSTAEVTPKVLSGSDCAEATHFIRGAMIGAFAMQSSAKAEAKAAVDVFKASASAGSASSLQIKNSDGVYDECLKASPDDAKPRGQCAGIVRLELVAINKTGQSSTAGAGEGADSHETQPTAENTSCPAGMHWADGHCTKGDSQAHACKEGDLPDCNEQCGKGNANSCNTLGIMYQRGGKDMKPDAAKAEASYLSACSKGLAAACGNVANLYFYGATGVTKSPDNFKKYANQGCNGGDGRSCMLLANAYFASDSNDERLRSGPLYVRSCNAGYANGCYQFGYKLNSIDRERFGKSFLAAQPTGIVFLGKACKAGLDYACTSTGDTYAGGLGGIERDGLKALELYTIACDRGSAAGCYRAGHLYEYGLLTKDEGKAAGFYQRACEMKTTDGSKPAYGSEKGCMYLGRMFERGAGGLSKDEVKAASLYKKACDPDEKTGSREACGDLARIYEQGKGVPKNPQKAAEIIAYGCQSWGGPTCFALGGRYASGQGLPAGEKKDEKKAAELYNRACSSSPEACLAYSPLLAAGKSGLTKNEKSAVFVLMRGCGLAANHDVDIEHGAAVGQACAKFASAEAGGKNIDKNELKAYEHFVLACGRGDKPSCDQAKKLTPPKK